MTVACASLQGVEGAQELWCWLLPTQSYTPPLVAGGRVFVLGADRSLTALDADGFAEGDRGLQFAGTVRRCDGGLFDRCRLKYLKRFPYAVFKGGEVWLILPDRMKYTDNRLGFGKKLLWQRK